MGRFPSLWACVGLRWLLGPLWAFVDKLYIQKKYIKKKNSPMAETTPDASFGPFSLFVGFLFPLRWPSLAAVGLHGPSWLSSAPKRGVVGVVQPAKLVSCTVKKNTATKL